MGFGTDQVDLQYKILNRSTGPAVWATRAQADREGNKRAMAKSLETQPNLTLAYGNVVDLLVKDGKVYGVITGEGEVFYGRTVVLNAGTFLNGLIHIGDKNFRAGRAGEAPSIGLTDNLVKLGFQTVRLKTGTPPRLDTRSIDYSKTEISPGDEDVKFFSLRTETLNIKNILFWLTYSLTKRNGTLLSY